MQESAAAKEAAERVAAAATPQPVAASASVPVTTGDSQLGLLEKKRAAMEQGKQSAEREQAERLAKVTARVMQRIQGGQAAVDKHERDLAEQAKANEEAAAAEAAATAASEQRAALVSTYRAGF